jgi:flagellar biogenesis protein FliO
MRRKKVVASLIVGVFFGLSVSGEDTLSDQMASSRTKPWAFAADQSPIEPISVSEDKPARVFTAGSFNTSEADIPVAITESQIKKSESASWARMIWGGVAFVLFVLAGSFAIKKFRFGNFSKKAAIPIRMVHQFHLAPKRTLAVIEVAGEYLLLGVTDHSINLVKTLSLLDEDIAKGDSPAVFEKVFDEKLPSGEDFEMRSPRDFLSPRQQSKRTGFVE